MGITANPLGDNSQIIGMSLQGNLTDVNGLVTASSVSPSYVTDHGISVTSLDNRVITDYVKGTDTAYSVSCQFRKNGAASGTTDYMFGDWETAEGVTSPRMVFAVTTLGKLSLLLGDGTNSWSSFNSIDLNPYLDDTYHHLVVSYNVNNIKIIIDNSEVASLTSTITAGVAGTENLMIGGSGIVDSAGSQFNGEISHFRVFNKALTVGSDITTINNEDTDATAPVVTVPSAISNLAGTNGDTETVLTWTAPSDGGATITGYNIYQDTVKVGTLVAGSPQTITGLTNGTSYDFDVRAVNSEGEASSSNIISVTPTATASSPTVISKTVTLANGSLATEAETVTAITFGANSKFALASSVTLPITLQPNTSTQITVEFDTDGLSGDFSDTMTIVTTNSGNFTVALNAIDG